MLAVKAGEIYTITQGVIKNGTVLVDGNLIVDVSQDLEIPDECEVINAENSILMPGLIDAHTHIGIIREGVGEIGSDHNEMSSPVTPQVRVIDAIDPFAPIFDEVLQSGITTVMIAPGSANPIGGQCSVLRTAGSTIEDRLLIQDAGMKFALGENPKRVYGSDKKNPVTRMGIAAIIREELSKAQRYLTMKEEYRIQKEGQPKEIDFKLEALVRVISGKSKARFHAHTASDIMTAIRIADEFDLDITLEHCTEGDMVLEEIAGRNIPVVLSPLMNARSKPETGRRNVAIAAAMANKGILTCIATDGVSQTACWLSINAGLCVRYGMKEEDALRAITINPAKVLGLEHRLGSIEKGKEADLVIMSGHPLEVRTQVQKVISRGKTVFGQ